MPKTQKSQRAAPGRAKRVQTPAAGSEDSPYRVKGLESTLIGVPLVGKAAYETYVNELHHVFSVIPGIEGNDEIPSTDDRIVPFAGYLAPLAISIREVNQLTDRSIVPLLRFAITMNGMPVYSAPPVSALDAAGALLEIHDIVRKLHAHEVKWWDEDSWRLRPVWYEGVPAVIGIFSPYQGNVTLIAVGNQLFPPDGRVTDLGAEAVSVMFKAVSILDTAVIWTRTTQVEPALPVLFTETPEGASPTTDDIPPAVQSEEQEELPQEDQTHAEDEQE